MNLDANNPFNLIRGLDLLSGTYISHCNFDWYRHLSESEVDVIWLAMISSSSKRRGGRCQVWILGKAGTINAGSACVGCM